MAEHGWRLALEFRDDAPGQDLAQLDAPLIERVDAPDRALGEDAVLVECHQRSERPGIERSARMRLVGLFPGNVRCGTSRSATPSVLTSLPVFPKARAS